MGDQQMTDVINGYLTEIKSQIVSDAGSVGIDSTELDDRAANALRDELDSGRLGTPDLAQLLSRSHHSKFADRQRQLVARNFELLAEIITEGSDGSLWGQSAPILEAPVRVDGQFVSCRYLTVESIDSLIDARKANARVVAGSAEAFEKRATELVQFMDDRGAQFLGGAFIEA
ncbi:hypothetical protein [Rhodococcus sp. ARC_M6]|uniref:hypothetical protein n=1 Tax=Rhodococcus sp. ARC_M6 TaxID=2928852 RepID=UPI001FB35ECC|nr:hypothetical protein [Rhodococcus sp. ARC_M6]MCJ0906242.1 hypothetical protein [Rhodococcus sp. ARC_M6]